MPESIPALAGLAVLTVGWLLQAIKIWSGHKDVNKWFVALYALGVLILVVDSIASGATSLALLNLASLAAALLVLLKLL